MGITNTNNIQNRCSIKKKKSLTVLAFAWLQNDQTLLYSIVGPY